MRNTSGRRETILQLLSRHGKVQISELVPLLGVSMVTIRNDLLLFESQGIAKRTHGGAVLAKSLSVEQSIDQKTALYQDQKNRIGKLAASMVAAGDNIIIDSGSTTRFLATHLREHASITVLTNGLNIAYELAYAPGVDLILTGGLLRKQSLSIQGNQAESCLQAYSFDKLFLGVDGMDFQFGATTHDEGEANLNRTMVERTRKVIVLCDASKFGKVSLHRIAQLDQVDAVITDAGIPDHYRDGLRELGIDLFIAD
ncbi:MAG: DeoR family transcriptional regulator [Burkholderiaceae bacterium]|nr:DeoR family transcriptional regulator [Burkholderiaceae bacterium]